MPWTSKKNFFSHGFLTIGCQVGILSFFCLLLLNTEPFCWVKWLILLEFQLIFPYLNESCHFSRRIQYFGSMISLFNKDMTVFQFLITLSTKLLFHSRSHRQSNYFSSVTACLLSASTSFADFGTKPWFVSRSSPSSPQSRIAATLWGNCCE